MDLQLVGKRVLVTGSSTGTGASIALSLAREGAFVIVHGRDPAILNSNFDRRITWEQGKRI
jgi:3-oxoacyl-[acyl-carrier protein] reductase